MKCPNCGFCFTSGKLQAEVVRLYESGLTAPEIYRILKKANWFKNYTSETSARVSVHNSIKRYKAKI